MTVTYGAGHIQTPLGIFKMIEIVAQLLVIILVSVDGGTDTLIEAVFVGSLIGLVVSTLILLLSITTFGVKCNSVLGWQFVFHVIWFIYMVIVSSVLFSRNYASKAFTAGGAFGLVAAVVYLLDAVTSYKCYGNRIACQCVS